MYRLHPGIYSANSHAGIISSLAPAAWFRHNTGITVSGSGVSQWDDVSGNSRHLQQGTDANRPVALLHTGTNYLYCPGVAGNYASMPDVALGTDLDVRIRLSMDDWTPAAQSDIVTKFDNGGGKYAFEFRKGAGTAGLAYQWSADGTTSVATKASSVDVSASDGDVRWLRVTHDVDNGAAGNDVKFYTSTDTTNDPDAVTWTQLGTTQTTAGTTSIANTANGILLGAWNAGANGNLAGKIYRAAVYNGIAGTKIADFNASDATDGASSFASSTTGETWTVNTSGALPAQIVGRSSLLFNGTSHYLSTAAASITLADPVTIYLLFKAVSWTSNDTLFGATSNDCNISQQTATPKIGIFAGAAAAENAGLAVGTVGILACVFNSANSLVQFNNGTPTTGNPQACSGTQFSLGAALAGVAPANIQGYELILFNGSAHDASQRARVIRSLSRVGQLGV